MRKKHFLGLIVRCRDEFFIEEFCNYYLGEGVDVINILDDNSDDKSIYNNLQTKNNINIIWGENIIETDYVNTLYKKIKEEFEWLIYVDVDEFITTKKNETNTIRDELQTTFKNADCVKIPWVFMSCNQLEISPDSVLKTNIYHPSTRHVFFI